MVKSMSLFSLYDFSFTTKIKLLTPFHRMERVFWFGGYSSLCNEKFTYHL